MLVAHAHAQAGASGLRNSLIQTLMRLRVCMIYAYVCVDIVWWPARPARGSLVAQGSQASCTTDRLTYTVQRFQRPTETRQLNTVGCSEVDGTLRVTRLEDVRGDDRFGFAFVQWHLTTLLPYVETIVSIARVDSMCARWIAGNM